MRVIKGSLVNLKLLTSTVKSLVKISVWALIEVECKEELSR